MLSFPDTRRGVLANLVALVSLIAFLPAVGFALPSASEPAARTTDAATDEPARGWLGFRFELVRDGAGLKIRDLVPGASAERGGLQPGDVIVAMNDVDFVFESRHDVGDGLAWIRTGDTVRLTVERPTADGTFASRTVDIVADPIPPGLLEARARHREQESHGHGNGAKIAALQVLERELRREPLTILVTRDADGVLQPSPARPLPIAKTVLAEVLHLERNEALHALAPGESLEATLRLEDGRRFVLDTR